MDHTMEQMLPVLKAVASTARLQLLAALIDQPRSTAELAAQTGLKEALVARHLGVLQAADLLHVDQIDQARRYKLNDATLHQLSKTVFARERSRTSDQMIGLTAAERKVLDTFIQDDRLVQLPEQWGEKHVVLLRWLAEKFERDVRYPERQINETLKRYHEDCATLRRYMVGFGLMQRERGIYWRN